MALLERHTDMDLLIFFRYQSVLKIIILYFKKSKQVKYSKQWYKDQESIQSSTTPDPGYQ